MSINPAIKAINRIPLVTLFLAIAHAVSGLAILMVSSWFIAASAVAGIGFNYMLPAVVIRALALIRISSGYTEMWVGHRHLLESLQKLRINLFTTMKNQPEPSSAEEADKLTYHTEAVASVWVGWVAQNASAWLSATSIMIFTLWFVPLLSITWLIFFILSLVLAFAILMISVRQANQLASLRVKLEQDIEFKINSVDIWHLYKNNRLPNASDFYHQVASIKTIQKLAEWALLVISIMGIVTSILVLNDAQHYQPMGLVIPMVLLAAPDWLGRVFATNTRLLDFFDGKRALKAKASTRQTESNQIEDKLIRNNQSKSLIDKLASIESLTLTDFLPSTAQHQPVSINIESPSLVLIKGDSGIGKSRFLKAVSGFLSFNGGYHINEVSVAKKLDINQHILYTEQSPYCLSGTLKDNLVIANPHASDEDCLRVLKSLNLDTLTSLGEWVGTNGRSLSGGELKRLGLARAMLSSASVVLLDEPFEGLDIINIENVSRKIEKMASDRIVIVVSHLQPDNLMFSKKVRLD